jgi:hypothetical protein
MKLKIGDIITQQTSDGNICFKVEILEVGKYKTLVKVLDSRVEKLIGKEQLWITDILKELKGIN